MFSTYVKIALRNMLRRKEYSFVGIAGMTIGMGCCILLLVFIQHEWSYDSFHKDGDRIYRVVTQRKDPQGERVRVALSPLPLAGALRQDIPEVETAVRVVDGEVDIARGGDLFRQSVLFADPDFFTTFSFPLVQGNPRTVLEQSTSVVLTSSAARKYFGDENPIGKRLRINAQEQTDVVVSGVAADPRSNTNVPFEMILPMRLLPGYRDLELNWGSSNLYTFLKLTRGADVQNVGAKFGPFVEKHYADRIKQGRESGSLSSDGEAWQLQLQPISDIHMNTQVRWGIVPAVSPLQSFVLAGMALVIIFIACTNYAMLAVARSSERSREVGVRRVFGAGRKDVMAQFWGEALLISIIGASLGFVLAELLLPQFNQLVGRMLSIESSLSLPTLLAGMALVVLTGMAAGSYPALFLSRVRPAAALQQSIKFGGKQIVGRVVIVTQFAMGIVFLVGVIVMTKQLDFVRTYKLGYDNANVVVVPAENVESSTVRTFVTESRQIPGVDAVTTVNNSFTRGGMRAAIASDGRSVQASVYLVDENFLRTLGIELKEGSDFPAAIPDPAPALAVVNETMAREFQWQSAIGKKLEIGGNPQVVGVVKDFHFQSLKNAIQPAMFYLYPRASAGNVLVKMEPGTTAETMKRLAQLWNRVVPNVAFEGYFLDNDIQRQYLEDQRWSLTVKFAGMFSVGIAVMGLFGMASLVTARRTKEVGIRKVLGASAAGLVGMLSKEFVRLVLVASVIALPVAYYAMSLWLEDFAYRVEMSWWMFALAGGVALLIALLTVSIQALRVALANPIEALRYE